MSPPSESSTTPGARPPGVNWPAGEDHGVVERGLARGREPGDLRPRRPAGRSSARRRSAGSEPSRRRRPDVGGQRVRKSLAAAFCAASGSPSMLPGGVEQPASTSRSLVGMRSTEPPPVRPSSSTSNASAGSRRRPRRGRGDHGRHRRVAGGVDRGDARWPPSVCALGAAGQRRQTAATAAAPAMAALLTGAHRRAAANGSASPKISAGRPSPRSARCSRERRPDARRLRARPRKRPSAPIPAP